MAAEPPGCRPKGVLPTAMPISASGEPASPGALGASAVAPAGVHAVSLRAAPFPGLLIAFVLAGVVTTWLGPLLPWLGHRWRLDDARLGAFFLAQFSASMLGVLLSSWLLPRGRFRAAIGCGLGLLALGVAGLAAASSIGALAAVAIYGLGLGLVIPGGNLLAAHAAAPNSAAALNLLNFAWGAGAVASPALAGLIVRSARAAVVLDAFAALVALAALFWLAAPDAAPKPAAHPPRPWRAAPFAPLPPAVPTAPRSRSPEGQSARKVGRLRQAYRRALAAWGAWLLLACLFFLYIGCENSVGGWVAALAHRAGLAGAAWLLPAGLFWGGLLGGRALAPLLLRRRESRRLARAALLLALAGIALLIAIPSRGFAAAESARAVGFLMDAAASLAGLGLSVVFPTLLSLLSPAEAGAAPPPAADPLLFVPAGLGGAVLPWLVGALSHYSGSLRAALLLPLAAALALFLLLPRAARHTAPAPTRATTL